jgi:hypothetical protein
MKRRPRKIEQKVAQHLTAFFNSLGLSEVHRVPVLGRTGPDIEINEFGLIVDVKSRLSVPTASFPGMAMNDVLVWAPLDQLNGLYLLNGDVSDTGKSKMADDWLAHMHQWTTEKYAAWRDENPKYPEKGISAIVLHKAAKRNRAKMPVGKAVFIMYKTDLDLFKQRYRLSQYLKNK